MELLHRRVVPLGDLRTAGQAMLLAAVALPLLPDGAGIPCPLRTFTGIPCPLCGMTTSVAATVHGDLVAAAAANPAGLLAVATAVVLILARRTEAIRLPPALIPAGLSAMWVFELLRFGVI